MVDSQTIPSLVEKNIRGDTNDKIIKYITGINMNGCNQRYSGTK